MAEHANLLIRSIRESKQENFMAAEYLHLENCNFVDRPLGGSLTFARQMISVLGNRAALVGLADVAQPKGQWHQRLINDVEYDYFGFAGVQLDFKRPLVPDRLRVYLAMRRWLPAIRQKGIKRIFVGCPEILLAAQNYKWDSVCYSFAGVANPVTSSRYPALRCLAGAFEKQLFKALAKTKATMVAAADDRAIEAMAQRSNGLIKASDVIKFPTRFDDKLFVPMDSASCRQELELPMERKIIVCNGRLSMVKGWALLVDAFKILQKKHPQSLLIFIGDGEDRTQVETACVSLPKESYILAGRVTPEQVVKYLNAADVVAIPSLVEGWSNAMIEALGCGKPMVSTPISGAFDMVTEGKNGYIVMERNPQDYADALLKAFDLGPYNPVSLTMSRTFSVSTLAQDFDRIWLKK